MFLVASIAFVLLWLWSCPTIDTSGVAAQYLLPYPNVISPIQQQNSGETTDYEEAFRLYELGYFGRAEDSFAKLDPDDEAVQFYRSVNALLDNNSELASSGFAGILVREEHRFYQPAQWYCALEYLLSGKETQAESILEELANGGSNFAPQANELLEDLN